MRALANGYFKLLRFLMVACLALMVVLVFGNVVLRYGFNSGITVSEELSRWLFVWLTFIGAIVAMREHAHLGMDSVVARLPHWGKRACLIASQLLMLLCVYLFFVGAWDQTLINIDNKAPATGLSSGFFYGIGLVFCVSAAGILLHDLWRSVRGKLSDEELIQVRESEDAAELEEMQREGVRTEPSRTPAGGSR
ncbi:MAG TPA: TRAP transporter small permease [Casimicrobiaceae bacterium]|nr:TRAP transporter small permease [Casimicrobiaceae bacterium]